MMAAPSEALAAALVTSQSGVNVYSTPSDSIVAPAIVIRPAEPWREPDRFCYDLQRYHAICVVAAASPQDGLGRLYAMTNGVIATAIDIEGWDWETVGAPIVDETTGTAFLAAPVRLSYRNTEEEAS